MKYRGIFEYEYPTEHKPPVSIDVYLHGDCVQGKIIEWEYRPLEQEPSGDAISREDALMCLTGEIKDTDTIETIIARFARRIRKLPPATPHPNTGSKVLEV